MSAFLDFYWAQIGKQRDVSLTEIITAVKMRGSFDSEEQVSGPALGGIAGHLLHAIELAPPGEFYVDTVQVDGGDWPYGREALHDAISVAAGAIHHHAMKVWRPKVRAQANQELASAIAAINEVRELENLFDIGDLGLAAMQFERLAAERIQSAQAEKIGRGSPGIDHRRTISEAVADVWHRRTGRPIPRAGTKGDHPLQRLLLAVSKDLFDTAGILSTNNLRPRSK